MRKAYIKISTGIDLDSIPQNMQPFINLDLLNAKFDTRFPNLEINVDFQYLAAWKLTAKLIHRFDDSLFDSLPETVESCYNRIIRLQTVHGMALISSIMGISLRDFLQEPQRKWAREHVHNFVQNKKDEIANSLRNAKQYKELTIFLSTCEDYHWFFSSPNNPMTQLNDTVFNHAVRLWLGIPQCDNSIGVMDGINCLKCGVPMDALGEHAFKCCKIIGPARRNTHDLIRDSSYYLTRQRNRGDGANFRLLREQNISSFYRNTVTINRDHQPVHSNPGRENQSLDRSDMSIIHSDQTQSRMVDFVTVYPSIPAQVPFQGKNITRQQYNIHANIAELKKQVKYQERFNLDDATLQSSVIGAGIDIYGAFGDQLQQLFKYLVHVTFGDNIDGRQQGLSVGDEWQRADLIRRYREYAQVALMRGNSDNLRFWMRECCPQLQSWRDG